ncbi:MAG: hypothetical protein WC728_16625 [Elusimicrobiota bacterium]
MRRMTVSLALLVLGAARLADAAAMQELRRLGTADEKSIPRIEPKALRTPVVALRMPDWAGEYERQGAKLTVKKLLGQRTLAFSLRSARETAGVLDARGSSVNEYGFEKGGCRVKMGFSVTNKAFVEASKGCGAGEVNGVYRLISREEPEAEFGGYEMNEDGMSGKLVMKRLGKDSRHYAFEIYSVNTVRHTHPTAWMQGLATLEGGELRADAGEGCSFPIRRSADNGQLVLKGVAENPACRVWMGMGASVDGTYVRR